MIRYVPKNRQEHKLRVEYVNSNEYDPSYWAGYRDYVVANVSGVLAAAYRDGDDSDFIEELVFENDKSLSWFILKYS